jgi:hypothetical protein
MTPLPIFLSTIIPGAGTLVVSFTIVGKSRHLAHALLRAKKVGHQISVSFEKFDVVQALLSFF